ncbi:MAG TPA: nucleotidyltransferase family protein [Gemmatimonadaceae bacterium]|nr:nucleotidyltransferase family protein [Gemmatimonadaceae bacterium]
MRPETALVIALSRIPIRDAARQRVHRLVGEGIDWEAVLTLATQWQVEPAVFGNLGSELLEAMPAAVLSRAAELEKLSRAYAISRTLILTQLVKSLDRAGVPSIVLKGPAVAIAAYDDYSRRTFADADLLVRRRDLIRARDLVLSRGYSARYRPERENGLIAGQHALEFSDSRTSVELHWTLLSRHLRFNLDVDDLWSHAVVTPCMDSQMRVLAPEHLFLYLCAHGAKHEWRIFRWVCDIAQLADRLTPTQAERVMGLANDAHAKRLLALGLRLVREMFGEEGSPFPPAAFGSERETARLVALVRARLTSEAVASSGLVPRRMAHIHHYMEPLAFWLLSRERMSDRLACSAQFFFVPAAGDSSRGQLQRVFRPVRLAAKAIRRLAHAS